MIKLNQLIYSKEFNHAMTQRLLYAVGSSDWLEQLLDIIKEYDGLMGMNKSQIEALIHSLEENSPKKINVVYSELSDAEKIELFINNLNETINDLNDKAKALKRALKNNKSFKIIHNGVVLPNAEIIFEEGN